MNKHRHAERLSWVSSGVMEVNNSRYGCFLDNISNTGALIRFSETDAPTLKPGAVCKLKVILLNVIEYPCKIVRINYPKVGILFL
jgi:hypothetical protein